MFIRLGIVDNIQNEPRYLQATCTLSGAVLPKVSMLSYGPTDSCLSFFPSFGPGWPTFRITKSAVAGETEETERPGR